MMGRSYCLGAALALLLVLAGCAAPVEAAEGGAGPAAGSAPPRGGRGPGGRPGGH